MMLNPFQTLSASREDFHRRILEGDPSALRAFEAYQESLFGPDALADRAFDWPEELHHRATVLTIPRTSPLLAWRAWSVVGTRLVAPFLVSDWQVKPNAPGVAWAKGTNTVSTRWCRGGSGQHPQAAPSLCHCGIRGVQSRTALDAYTRHMQATSDAPGAVAVVEVFGTVAAYAGDDFRYTLRASHAALAGPLELDQAHADVADALARRYGVEVVIS